MLYAEYIVPGSIAVCFSFVAWLYFRNKAQPPTLHYVESDLHDYILKTRMRFTSPFRPPWWLQNNHLQTIVAALLPKPKVNFKREYLDLEDGGVLALDWVVDNEDSLSEASTVLIVVPGMTAGREDMSNICMIATERGYRAVVFNKRGHGDSALVTPKLCGFGDTSDFRYCVEYMAKRFPLAKIVTVGSSAGTGLIASYLGEYGPDCIIRTGSGICPEYDARDLFVTRLTGFYEFLLLRGLKKLLKRHAKVLSSVIDVKAACGATRLRDFDTEVYCKIYGYKDVWEYWNNHHPMRSILKKAVPFMCITSLDDPVCSPKNIPFQMFSENADWLLVTTEWGGHCGYLENGSLKPWCDNLALDYIDAVLEFQTERTGDSM